MSAPTRDVPSGVSDVLFDEELIQVEPRPVRKSGNAAPASDLLFGDMKQTEAADGKMVVRPIITPSPYMQDILNFLAVPGPNLVVDATAGGGKTTLLELISDQMIALGLLDTDRACFLAFNKHIVKSLTQRLPVELDIRTISSLGQVIIREHCPGIPFDPKKYEKLISEAVRNRKNLPRGSDLQAQVMTSLTLTMSNLLELGTDFEDWRTVMTTFDLPVGQEDSDLYGLTFEVLRRGMELLTRTEERSSDDTTEWMSGFLDQSYAAFYYKWRMEVPFKYVLIDEAQDLNLAQMNLIEVATDEHSRIIAVGDPSQAIYGFQGSLASSMHDFASYINATIMPLSVSYRCPRRHVALAAEYTTRIEAADTAIDGELADITGGDMLGLLREGDMVLCRTNSPLVRWFFLLLRQRFRCHIRGVDMAQSLVKMIKEVSTWDGKKPDLTKYSDDLDINPDVFTQQLRSHLMAARARIREEAARSGKPGDLRLALADDRSMCLKTILDESKAETTGELIKQTRALFSEANGGVVLSTVHKSKGLEADNVFIVEPQLLPHPRAESEQAILSERAVKFVALTRAKKSLYFVDAQEPEVPESLSSRPVAV